MDAVELPDWLQALRKVEITDRVRTDPRSEGNSLLGMSADAAQRAIAFGQANFAEARGNLSPDDLVLLYAHLNQLGHIEELVEAFRQYFSDSSLPDPIVLDLGCGPFTGGLALAATLTESRFDYIGVDASEAMRLLGERLASSTLIPGEVTRLWAPTVDAVEWPHPPGWREVIVIVSYLFASPTLDSEALFHDLIALLDRLGRGGVTLLYTNSIRDKANRAYPAFRDNLRGADFRVVEDASGEIVVGRRDGPMQRPLRYALLRRKRRGKLRLGRK